MDPFHGLVGGSAFWKNYAERIVSKITNGHARLKYLTQIKERYKYIVENVVDNELCRGCRYFFIGNSSNCHICGEFFCMYPTPQCTLKRCSRCKKDCCLSDRTFDDRSNLICIDCYDYHGDGDVDEHSDESMILESDSEQLSPSESEEEEEGSE